MTWHEQNDAFLSAAVAWLRQRLADLGPSVPPLAEPDPPRRRRRPPAAIALPAAAEGIDVDEAERAMDVPPALAVLARRFGLSRYERDVLLLCVAMELDPSLARLCASAHDEGGPPAPTFALAYNLFDDPSWDPVRPDRPLRRFGFLEVLQQGNLSLTNSPLRADERIVGFVKGLTYLDDRLEPLLVRIDADVDGPPAPSQTELVERIVAELDATAPDQPLPVIQLLGADAETKQLVAQSAAAARELPLFRLPAELLPTDAAELERLVRLWQRESLLMPSALLVLGAGDATRFVNRCVGPLLFVDTDDPLTTYGTTSVVLDVPLPTPAEQASAWSAALGPDAQDAVSELSAQFNLSVPAIQRIAVSTRSGHAGAPPAGRAWQRALIETRRGLDTLAQRIDPRATWSDIVLPEPQRRLLHRIAEQVGERRRVYETWGFARRTARGLGISALFAGPSGTGKTMAAEVLANELRLNLYRIDLSAVVSKYIGETEKNLARLFDAAEAGGVVLFFDEADALFGKRTEVRDSHDRYANIETDYLLQRMEAYQGLAILGTNMRSSLDTAFVRRLRFIVEFPYPSRDERRRIWEHMFPPETPTEGLDFDRLATLSFSGGNVFTIAVNAAFLASRAGTGVTMTHVLEAARAETVKLELPLNELDFELAT